MRPKDKKLMKEEKKISRWSFFGKHRGFKKQNIQSRGYSKFIVSYKYVQVTADIELHTLKRTCERACESKVGRVQVWGLNELQKVTDKADGRFWGELRTLTC